MTADAIRLLNFVLCGLAFAGLMWRILGRWGLCYPTAKWLAVPYALLELIVALGSGRALQIGGPFNEIQYLVLAHALATLAIIAWWPRILEPGSPKQGEGGVR